MLRNDYRRALIMLRGLRQGVSGYVRLERRTLIGTLQFTVNGAPSDAELYALLLYGQNGLWYACLLDRLGPARYGQAGMVYRFDPRSICGRELDRYALIAVAGVSGDACELLLAGYLNGSVETDWPQVRQAVCQALAPARPDEEPAPAGDEAGREAPPIPKIAAREEDEMSGEAQGGRDGADGGEATAPSVTCGPESAPDDGADEQDTASAAGEAPPVRDDFDHPARAASAGLRDNPPEKDEFDTPAAPQPAEPPPEAAAKALPAETAGEALGLDMTLPWPDSIEPMRPLFQQSAPVQPFEAEGFVLIRAPIAVQTGLDHCVVGVQPEAGRPGRVLYAVPGRYAPAPPPGLEGYEWRGGGAEGYWVVVRPVAEGASQNSPG